MICQGLCDRGYGFRNPLNKKPSYSIETWLGICSESFFEILGNKMYDSLSTIIAKQFVKIDIPKGRSR